MYKNKIQLVSCFLSASTVKFFSFIFIPASSHIDIKYSYSSSEVRGFY